MKNCQIPKITIFSVKSQFLFWPMYFHEKKMLNSKNCNFSRQIAILNILHDNEIFFGQVKTLFGKWKCNALFFKVFSCLNIICGCATEPKKYFVLHVCYKNLKVGFGMVYFSPLVVQFLNRKNVWSQADDSALYLINIRSKSWHRTR